MFDVGAAVGAAVGHVVTEEYSYEAHVVTDQYRLGCSLLQSGATFLWCKKSRSSLALHSEYRINAQRVVKAIST